MAACGTAGFCDDGDLVTCLKAKAVAALDDAGRADALPLAGPVALVRDGPPPGAATTPPVAEHELRAKPESELDAMLYDRAFGLFAGRSLRVGPSAEPPEQGMTTTMGDPPPVYGIFFLSIVSDVTFKRNRFFFFVSCL